MMPVTAKPYFGSLSSMLCPPITLQDAEAITSAPPSMTLERISKPISSLGQLTSCRAEIG